MCLISSISFAPKLLSQIINYFQNLQVKKESEVVNSSTSTDFDASMETTLVVQTTDKEYREEKSRHVVCIVDQESSPLNLKTNPMYKISRHFDQYLRTFAPIATAHFFAHVTHSSCIADHEGNKHGIEAQTFSRRKERKSMWHHEIVVDPGLLGNVTQLVTV